MTRVVDAQGRLLEVLLERASFITGPELAAVLGVSAKSVYRMVVDLNHDDAIIESRRGRGYRLDREAYLRRLSSGEGRPEGSVTPPERRRRILRELLDAARGVPGEDLERGHFISDSQVRADLKEIDQLLAPYALKVRQRSGRYVVVGREAAIRSVLADLLRDGAPEVTHPGPGSSLQAADMEFARGEVAFITGRLGAVLPPPYDLNLATHLYVLIARTRAGARSDAAPGPTPSGDAGRQRRYWEVAAEVRGHVERHLGRPLPDGETDHIYAYIASSRLDPTAPVPAPAADEASRVVGELVAQMSRAQGVRFGTQRLLTDLARHVRPMLNRLRFGLYVTNPVLPQLASSYPALLADLTLATAQVGRDFGLPEVPADEVGFMALYFARELELCATPVSALMACSSGVGTSELLRAKAARFFPEISVVGVVGASQVAAALASEPSIDLVITTVGIPDPVTVPVVLVDAMFSPESQDRVRATLRRLG
ncbi:HTH domain-containing protein [Propioniciclava coleopterorum]|uniref:HTH domain-containing protein n=1 Tax=Propioniciclava coleopterorum TaxID=2714937 RepID=A0A6G7Y2I5_9ACTN|nr:HTH domain-containing protein [Propioniciclava coleopterorum]QIK71025.1 HTH domain-containing protein [Propioniciclava coleopterorum]